MLFSTSKIKQVGLLIILLGTITQTGIAGNSITKYIGEDATINWSVGGGADSCSPSFDGATPNTGAYNAWLSGNKQGTGSQTFTVANGTNFSTPGTYTLRCTDTYNQSASDAATITFSCPVGSAWNSSAAVCVYPPTVTASLTPTTIAYGGSFTSLTYNSTHTTYCDIYNNGVLGWGNAPVTYTWGPTGPYYSTVTWTITCFNNVNQSASQSVTLTVTPNSGPNPPTISGPTTGTPNGSNSYTVVATDPNGDQLRYGIDWDMDGVADEWLPAGSTYVNSGTSQSTSHNWGSPGTKTFQAIAQDSWGTNSSWTTYSVNISCPVGQAFGNNACISAPTVTASLAPTSISYGGSFTSLSYNSTNASYCDVYNNGVLAWGNAPTTYTWGQTGPYYSTVTWNFVCYDITGRSASQSVTLTVAPAPTVDVSLTPTTIPYGGYFDSMNYTSANTSYCDIYVGGNMSWPHAPTAFSWDRTGPYYGNQTWTYTCYNDAGVSATKSVTLTVSPAPTVTTSMNPTHIAYGGYFDSASYSSTNADYCRITLDGTPMAYGGPTSYDWPTSMSWGQNGPYYSDHTWVVTCYNGAGQSASQSMTLTVDPAPTISATLNPTTSISYGGYFDSMSYTSTNSTYCEVYSAGNPALYTSNSYQWPTAFSWGRTGPYYSSNTWTFVCYNSAGQHISASKTLTVQPNSIPLPPSITGPTTGFPSTTYEFDITGTDSNGDTIKYEVDWDMNGTVDQTVPSPSTYVPSGTMQPVYNDWASVGTKTFEARTVDSWGGTSGWTTFTITINTPPVVLDATMNANCAVEPPAPTLSLQCGNSDYYQVKNSANIIVSGGPQTSATINIPDVDETYNVVCKSGGASGYSSGAVYRSYTTNMCTPKSAVLTANPRSINKGGSSSFDWTIIRPGSSCNLTAAVVCTGGHTACTQDRLNAETALNQKIQTENTDANDPNNAGTVRKVVADAIKKYAPGISGKAIGKKTLQLDYTTDFTLDCGSGIQSKVRVQVTTDNEG
ncbi:MAG: hypothetical protein JWN37_5 [Candidatus Nomurabacteria bacterium]|nr:hypothetical protein [Candidatus Nomurabacteria bacterium]